MGYNTTVVVMNDALNQIAEDKDFGKNLADAIMMTNGRGGKYDVSSGGHCNAASVIESHHADGSIAVVVGGNMGEVLGYAGTCRNGNEYVKDETERKAKYFKELARNLGYRVVKLPTKGK